MRIIFLGQKQLKIFIIGLICIIFISGIIVNRERIARQAFGVKQGVRLEGQLLQGLLPDEVASVVKVLAEKVSREPRNACYYGETGEIIPAEAGKAVNIAINVRRVFTAKPGTNLDLLISEVTPDISEDYFKPVYHGKEDSPRAALAINVAWGEEYLGEILKTLRSEKVKATFFFVGTWVKAFPEMVRTIAADGHEVANHGLYHGHPEQMGQEELRKLILENTSLLTSIVGKKPVNLFAPPYGELNAQIVRVAGQLGYRTIMWSVDSIDWKNPAPEVLLDRVLSKVKPGGIILLHPTISTKESLPILIKSLRKRGLEPGTVSSVL